MGERTEISWTDHTFNPVIGCAKVSPGCTNCYAEAMAKRYGWHDWQNDTPRHVTSAGYWAQPHRWNRAAELAGERHRVFCASLADVFDPQWPAGIRDRLWETIDATPWLDWLLLTKRPHLARRFWPASWLGSDVPAPNVWLGFTAEDQAHYDRRWHHVAALPAVVRFVSFEPALGRVALKSHNGLRPDFVICGGESGPGARPMAAYWARQMQKQCELRGIAFFFKQWGQYANNPLTRAVGELEAKLRDPKTNGKGGALLDGVLYRELPTVAASR